MSFGRDRIASHTLLLQQCLVGGRFHEGEEETEKERKGEKRSVYHPASIHLVG